MPDPSPMTAIANAIKEALELWKTFIATRQQAYERNMDKRMRTAIDTGEQIIERIRVLEIKDKELDKLILVFFRYNN